MPIPVGLCRSGVVAVRTLKGLFTEVNAGVVLGESGTLGEPDSALTTFERSLTRMYKFVLPSLT